jgi:TolB-like protein
MEDQPTQRRLVAVLIADIAGYTRLMEQDTDGTVAAWQTARREVIKPVIADHSGKIVKLTGDGFLVEFLTVQDAVNCAIAMQRGLAPSSLDFRMGVNMGDIVDDGEDIHGEGVNIAARLEGLADPGGICISGDVYNQVRNRIETTFEDLGDQEVKNVSQPVQAYAIRLNDSDAPPASGDPAISDKPSIAVLAFENMSGDTEQDYFADGIAEDIITALSRFHWFFVISRNTSFTYRGVATDAKRVAEELGVRYVLEGSVRKGGDRVRITAQLIDAHVDHHIWAKHYDRELADIFAVQDEITEQIIRSVAPGIISTEMQRAQRKDITTLGAWDRIMRAHWHFARFTKEDNIEARRLLTEASQIEPSSAIALGDLAMIHVLDAHWGWCVSRDQSLAAAAELARHAVTIDESNAWGHTALGFVELFSNRHDEAIRRLEHAIELSPNDANAHGFLSMTLALAGDYDGAVAQVNEAMRLSPRDPFLALWYNSRSVAAFVGKRYEEAVVWAKKTNEENPRFPGAYRLLTSSCGQLGRLDEAKVAREKLLRLAPGMTIATTRKQVPWKNPDDRDRYLEGLRKAGLPE